MPSVDDFQIESIPVSSLNDSDFTLDEDATKKNLERILAAGAAATSQATGAMIGALTSPAAGMASQEGQQQAMAQRAQDVASGIGAGQELAGRAYGALTNPAAAEASASYRQRMADLTRMGMMMGGGAAALQAPVPEGALPEAWAALNTQVGQLRYPSIPVPEYEKLQQKRRYIEQGGMGAQILAEPGRDPRIEAQIPTYVHALEGITDSVKNTVDFFNTPLGAATLGIGSLPAVMQRAISAGFATQMASQVPEIARELGTELGKPKAEQDPRKIAKLIADGAATVGFSALSGSHALAPLEGPPGLNIRNLPIPREAGAMPVPPLVAEGGRAAAPQQFVTLKQALDFAKAGEPVARSLEEKRVVPEAPIGEPTYPPSALGRPVEEPVPIPMPQEGTIQAPPSALAPEYTSGRAAQVLREQVAAQSRIEDFNKAVAEKVAQEQVPPIHPDTPLTENQLRIIQESLRDAVLNNQLPGPTKTGISKSGLEKWADDVLKGGGAHGGSDVVAAYLIKGATLLERGIVDYANWAAEMVIAHGEKIRPQLRGLFEQAKQLRAASFNKKGAENARTIQETTAVHGDLRPSTREGEGQVPVAQGERGIFTQATGGLPETQEGKVLLTDPNTLVPALKPPEGPVVIGERGNIHDDIYKREQSRDKEAGLMLQTSEPEHGFWDGNKFLSRTEAAKRLGEPGELSAQRLNELQAKTKTPEQAPAAATSAQQPVVEGVPEGVTNPRTTLSTFGVLQQPIERLMNKAIPAVKAGYKFAKAVAHESQNLPPSSDYRKAVDHWSAKLQRSFGESAKWQKDITKAVRDPIRRDAITNWIQANGDIALLNRRAAATTDATLRRGYETATRLTPDEIALARHIKDTFDTWHGIGTAAGILNSFKDNYVPQVWDLGKSWMGIGGARTLKQKFKFAKASTFPTFFDGEQAGYTPKTKDISKILPMYLHEMNSVIAARELVNEIKSGVWPDDNRPLLADRGKDAVAGPGGTTIDVSDYRTIPKNPAIAAYKIHPDAYKRLNAVLGKSAIREWYQSYTTPIAEIPKALVRGIDFANRETKASMFGLLAPFHQVQEATHAFGHRVNPLFSIPKIDLMRNPAQMDAARHGLMLQPDRASADQFMEGLKAGGAIISKIPILGDISNFYSNYLFKQYIPGIKFKTYNAILDRNMKVYARDIAAGRVDASDVKILSSEQANAAFGHLNYADLGRNPTIQHMLQLGFLAPDFLEARGRFALQSAKGVTGAKVGREQLLALGTLAVGQAALAYTAAQLTGGEWDPKDPFAFHKGNRKYTLRSVPEDLVSLANDTRKFVYSRISPVIGKGIVEGLTGRDYRGRKMTGGEVAKDIASTAIPLGVKGFVGKVVDVGNRTDINEWEQLAGASGLKISRYSPTFELMKKVEDWRKTAGPKQLAEAEHRAKETFVSDYGPLRDALQLNNVNRARAEYDKLIEAGKKPSDISKTLRPDVVTADFQVHKKPIPGLSLKDTSKFLKSLSPKDRKLYDESKAEQKANYQRFKDMLKQTNKPLPADQRGIDFGA